MLARRQEDIGDLSNSLNSMKVRHNLGKTSPVYDSVNILTLVHSSVMSKYCFWTSWFLAYLPGWTSWNFRRKMINTSGKIIWASRYSSGQVNFLVTRSDGRIEVNSKVAHWCDFMVEQRNMNVPYLHCQKLQCLANGYPFVRKKVTPKLLVSNIRLN